MKNENSQWLQEKIIEFMVIVEDYHNSTTYTSDRQIFMNDIAIAAKWLIELYKRVPLLDICREIVSPETSKYFGDYWKKDPWGDNEMRALNILKESIKEKFDI